MRLIIGDSSGFVEKVRKVQIYCGGVR